MMIMIFDIWTFLGGVFIMGVSCYAIYKFSDEFEYVGRELGLLLNLPEDVVSSTFAALATSAPEIVIAILTATNFIIDERWTAIHLGEKASFGTLNITFTAIDNLVGISALAIIFLLRKGVVKPEDAIRVKPNVLMALAFYVIISLMFSIYISDNLITETEAWILMIFGASFVISQFFFSDLLKHYQIKENSKELLIEQKNEIHQPVPQEFLRELFKYSFVFAFVVFALFALVRESMIATFTMAKVSIFSVSGIIIMFTSYVSSFPEFMMTFHLARANKQNAFLGLLVGSNVIALAFAGFRAMWLHEPIEIYTTGFMQSLLPYYIWALPVIAALFLLGLWTGKAKYKYAYPSVAIYLVYVISGFILL